jgi:transposase
MAYEKKFRERVLAYRAEGHTIRETAKHFGVGETTLKAWNKLVTSGEGLAIKPRKRVAPKLDPDKLRAYVAEHPDDYLHEIAAHFNCRSTAVHKALKRLNITRKKEGRV